MPSRTLEILVGFFVCLGLAAVFILTFRVAGLNGVEGGHGYTVTASFDNIGGLKPGAAVTLAGVKVGRVRNIGIDPSNFEALVTMEISDHYNNIPADSIGKILTAGLLGEQYISLDVGGADASLKEGSKLKFTQSALVLENIVGQFLASQTSKTPDKEKQP
ncbi:MAG: outer membrane lipid asymmetry maintenance protein MlaD [Nevskiaceae bacterium]|nr:MAG: outer membrane lipid asymmetry maintenance protein MlaD [Nevskiaceae bacterium]